MQQGIVDLSDVLINTRYLQLSPIDRQTICEGIINQSFGSMTVPATQKERVIAMKKILKKSVDFYSNKEEYENCVLLSDLLEAINLKFKY